jgi:hypothetical protein
MRSVKVTVHKTGSKLQFVKLIKDHTGLGLKEAKDWCDQSMDNLGRSYPITVRSIEDFKYDVRRLLSDFNISFDDREKQRQIKLLGLGIGDDSDKTDVLSEELSFELLDRIRRGESPYTSQDKSDIIQSFLKELLSELNSDQLDALITKHIQKEINDI